MSCWGVGKVRYLASLRSVPAFLHHACESVLLD